MQFKILDEVNSNMASEKDNLIDSNDKTGVFNRFCGAFTKKK